MDLNVSQEAPSVRTDIRHTYLLVGSIAFLQFVLHACAFQSYGYFRDELYYLASTSHIALGYVEHPPLSIYILAAWTTVFGDSLIAVRTLSALFSAGFVVLTGLIVREIRGGLIAQGVASLAIALTPVVLGSHFFYSMNSIDHFFWALIGLTFVITLEKGDHRLWILLGFLLGLGLLNKVSVAWLVAGIGAALVLTPHRRWLATRWPWVAGAIAAVIFLPYVLWQAQHDFPFLEFMRNASERKNVHQGALGFLLTQVSVAPQLSPLLLVGTFGLFVKEVRRWSALPIIFITTAAILIISGSSKDYYLVGAYPFAAVPGAILVERALWRRGWRWLLVAYITAIVVVGAIGAPFAIPLLPAEKFIAFRSSIGLSIQPQERHRMGPLPQHFADMFGWREMAENVARIYRTLSPEEQTHTVVFGQDYGQAGAIDILGRRLGLPHAISGHNSYWIWGPGETTGATFIVIDGDSTDLAKVFESIQFGGFTDHPYAMPFERNLPLFICRKARVPISDNWAKTKHFI
jgi:hypothetical protein